MYNELLNAIASRDTILWARKLSGEDGDLELDDPAAHFSALMDCFEQHPPEPKDLLERHGERSRLQLLSKSDSSQQVHLTFATLIAVKFVRAFSASSVVFKLVLVISGCSGD